MTARIQALNMLRAVARKDASGRIAHRFATDPGRMERMGVEAAGLYLDLSKQSWSAEGFEAALDLARTCDVEGRRDALFGGEAVNNPAGRAVLHPALRASEGADFKALGEAVSAEVDETRQAMAAFAADIGSG
ncbi:MAG TPA: glucose-6-phosphate isomerase, partial [Brevundimonas sp.]